MSRIFFSAEVGGEAGFVDDVVGEAQRHFLRDDAAGAVRDIGERTGVHKRRSSVRGLREIGQDGFGEQRHHAADGVKIACADWLSVARHADDDGFEARRRSLRSFGERQDCHDFAGGGDDEIRFAICTVALATDVERRMRRSARSFMSMARGQVI